MRRPTLVFNGNAATTAVSVNENSATGTVVATLSTSIRTTPLWVTNDAFNYTLADNYGGRFQIVGNQIQVLNGALLDFENPVHSYVLNVTTNDGHGGTRSEAITVDVANVNEAPINVALSNASFAENAANGFVIGALSAARSGGRRSAASRWPTMPTAGSRSCSTRARTHTGWPSPKTC